MQPLLWFTISLAIFAAHLTAAAEKPGAPSLFDDPVIARGKGVEIRRSQLEDAFISYKANLAARDQTLPESQRAFREAQMLERLITTQLMINRATDGDKIAAKGMAEKFNNDARKSAGSEEAFQRQLKAVGMSSEHYDRRIMEQAISEAVLDREVKSKIIISDSQVQDFYNNGIDAMVKIMQEELERLAKDPSTTPTQLASVKTQVDELRTNNLSRLGLPERVRVSHILISTRHRETEQELPEDQKKAKRQLAEQLLNRARAGEDFAKLVKEYSEDRNLKETGGEYTFARQDPFVPEFKAAAFSLATNQISDLVPTLFGYHIIKLHEKIAPRKIEFGKVSSEIKEALLQQEVQRAMPEYFERLKKEAGVEILDSKYKLGAPKTIDTSLSRG
jgi:parvulin-like peptidyl-prolyl isomerase